MCWGWRLVRPFAASQFWIYDSVDQVLYYDGDGSGLSSFATAVATFDTDVAITAADIVLV